MHFNCLWQQLVNVSNTALIISIWKHHNQMLFANSMENILYHTYVSSWQNNSKTTQNWHVALWNIWSVFSCLVIIPNMSVSQVYLKEFILYICQQQFFYSQLSPWQASPQNCSLQLKSRIYCSLEGTGWQLCALEGRGKGEETTRDLHLSYSHYTNANRRLKNRQHYRKQMVKELWWDPLLLIYQWFLCLSNIVTSTWVYGVLQYSYNSQYQTPKQYSHITSKLHTATEFSCVTGNVPFPPDMAMTDSLIRFYRASTYTPE